MFNVILNEVKDRLHNSFVTRMMILIGLLCVICPSSAFSQNEESLKPYAAGRVGLLALGLEAGLIQNEKTSYFALIESEGEPFFGSWNYYILGIQEKVSKTFYYRVGAGAQSSRPFYGDEVWGPAVTSSIGWEWKHDDFFWSFELTGLTVRYTLSEHAFAFVLHVPQFSIGYSF